MTNSKRIIAQIQLLSFFANEASVFDTAAFEHLARLGNDYGIERKMIYDIYCQKPLPTLVQPRNRKEKYQFLYDFMMVTMVEEQASYEIIARVIHYAKAIGFDAYVVQRKLMHHELVQCSVQDLNQLVHSIYQLETVGTKQSETKLKYWGAFQPLAIDDKRFLA